ncbi:MAG: hypothetical protein P8X64_10620 [Anaerolineales bacterium]
MDSKRSSILGLLPLAAVLTVLISACQTFNISVMVPTEPPATEGVAAATLPARWTATPIPEQLLPLESLTPVPAEQYTPGPDWDSPPFDTEDNQAEGRLGDFVNFVDVLDRYLLVGDNSGTLTIMDLTNPTDPYPLANIDLGYEERTLATEPGDPFSPPGSELSSEVRAVALENDLLYVMTIHRVLVFNLHDPADPVLLGLVSLPPRLNDFDVRNGALRVLSSQGGSNRVTLTTLDASNPASIEVVHVFEFPGTPAGRAGLAGDFAFVTRRSVETAEQFKLYGLDDTRPVKLGEAYGAPAFRAWIEGSHAFLSTARIESDYLGEYHVATASIWVVDITDPEYITSFSYIWAPNIATDLVLTDEMAIAIGGDLPAAFGEWGKSYWMTVADITDLTQPVVFRTLDLPGQALHLAWSRGITYVAAGQGGLQILRPESGEALSVLRGEDFQAAHGIEAGFNQRPTPTPLPAASGTPPSTPRATPTYSATYMAVNVDDYATFTVFWKPELWEQAAGPSYVCEDFERDAADYGELSYPYLTGNGFLLTGTSAAQIIQSQTLLPSGNLIHLRDWEKGLSFGFPEETSVQAFGFDYVPSEDWIVRFAGKQVEIPGGRRGFFGVVMKGKTLAEFNVTSLAHAQGGLTIDNIRCNLSPGQAAPTPLVPTPSQYFYPTGTPTAAVLD